MVKLARALAPFGMCFAPSKREVLQQPWTTVVPNFVLDEEELGIVLSYLGSWDSIVARQ